MRTRLLAVAALAVLFTITTVSAQLWRDAIEFALEKKASYNFDKIALADALRVIADDSGVNVILDTGASIDQLTKVSLAVKDMSLSAALTWLTRGMGLEWCIQDEAVFVTTYQRLGESARRQVEGRDAARRARAAKTWLPAIQEALSKKISVEYFEKSAADCRVALEKQLGVNIMLGPGVNPKAAVTLSLTRMTAESVLVWITRQVKADFAVIDEAIYIASTDEIRLKRAAGLDLSSFAKMHDAVSFDFRNVPLDEALADLSAKSGVKIEIRGGSKPFPKVSLSNNDMPLGEAIKALASRAGLSMAIVPEGGMLVVTIVSALSPAASQVTGEEKPAPQPAPIEPSSPPAPNPPGEEPPVTSTSSELGEKPADAGERPSDLQGQKGS